MAINNVSNRGATGQTGSTPESSSITGGNQALGNQDFMKLLIAQLKNQDPNNPVDTKDLVTQLSQLTSVEQLVTIGQGMSRLEAATHGMAANQSAGLIGKTVTASGDSVVLEASGGASTAVNLAQDAAKVTVSVRNEAGRVVRTFDLPSSRAGTHTIEWDGKDDKLERATAGTYKFEITAKDKAGNPIEADMSVTGLVSGVAYDHGYPELVLGNQKRVPLSSVSSIAQ